MPWYFGGGKGSVEAVLRVESNVIALINSVKYAEGILRCVAAVAIHRVKYIFRTAPSVCGRQPAIFFAERWPGAFVC